PGRKQDITVVAVTAPVRGAAPSRAAERFAVKAADHEERPGIVRRQLLDALPGPHQIFQGLLVALGVLVLQFIDRPANSEPVMCCHESRFPDGHQALSNLSILKPMYCTVRDTVFHRDPDTMNAIPDAAIQRS